MSRKRIAAVVTEYRRYSHAQHIVDRFLWGYGWGNRHHLPPVEVVSLYVDQFPDSDLSRDRSRQFPRMKIYPSIREAVTEGTNRVTVDGVLLIAEHGNYPRNEKGQKLYPRYEFFNEIVSTFRDHSRSVPVFNDKHLSWNWEWAREMVDTSKEMGFGFMAGSSVPIAPRLPAMDFPLGSVVTDAMCIAVGGPDGYDIHALEAIQCMVERRRGGETGVQAIQAYRGDSVWNWMKSDEWDQSLFESCLCRSHTVRSGSENLSHVLPRKEVIPDLVTQTPTIYVCEYRDGLKVTMILMEGLVADFTFAARLKNPNRIFSTQIYLPPREVCNFFNPLVHHTESLFLTGKSPYPIERTLLTTGMTAAGIESLWRDQSRIETPHLDVCYQPTRHSTFWRS